ncbi:MAG: hypothetical protein R2850_06780 [Bacteroidia bacterium]
MLGDKKGRLKVLFGFNDVLENTAYGERLLCQIFKLTLSLRFIAGVGLASELGCRNNTGFGSYE